ncbi:tryptophan halogenase family protein [Maricaulis sp.]|uniref:tryptophan halogenase family protein n=1 Tax=Maricaulis sp. TaxID=1486257 RepID=UPI00262C6E7F|nr:tryptophan halogenase family protein [Maricaulis sp.]
MKDLAIKDIVIVGGGTAGWMAAAGLSILLRDPSVRIRLIESDEIGIVGVGEATIPHIRYFNKLVKLDEPDFLRKTNATYKVGIEFINWGRIGDRYFHSFSPYGVNMDGYHFHHFWLRHAMGDNPTPASDYNLLALASKVNRFAPPQPQLKGSPLANLEYAFQFDSSLYGKYMRGLSESRGVTRIEGKIVDVQQRSEDGFIESVQLESGEKISGELFIDCSGFRGLLIEQTLKSGYIDWSRYLPVDRAVAQGCEQPGTILPYTRATAHQFGWQWRIPLQNRLGNGHVYCSEFISDDEAYATLQAGLEGEPMSEPRFLRFKTGVRAKPWNKNVVSLGLASGFLEPLESTSIHLVQSAIARLMTNFPDKVFNQADIDYYNRRTLLEFEQVRDFIILHYCATQREDSDFWNYVRTMELPETLQQRIEIYKENGRLYRHDNELFGEDSWFAVFEGQNIRPKRYHPGVNHLSDEMLEKRMAEVRRAMNKCLETFEDHETYLKRICQGVSRPAAAPARNPLPGRSAF